MHAYYSVCKKCGEKLCTPLGSYVNIYLKQKPQEYNLTSKRFPTVFRTTIYYYYVLSPEKVGYFERGIEGKISFDQSWLVKIFMSLYLKNKANEIKFN